MPQRRDTEEYPNATTSRSNWWPQVLAGCLSDPRSRSPKDGLPPGFLVLSRFIDDLLQQASPEQGARVLQDMIRYDEDEAGGLTVISPTDFAAIAEAYQRFRARGVIDLIGEERPPEELSSVIERLLAVDGSDSVAQLRDGATVTAKGTFARHLSSILGYSRRTGTAIISKGGGFIKRVTQYLASFELPRRADALVASKAALMERLYAKASGVRAGTFFVGAVVVVTGLFVTGGFVLPVGVAGAVLYFVDP